MKLGKPERAVRATGVMVTSRSMHDICVLINSTASSIQHSFDRMMPRSYVENKLDNLERLVRALREVYSADDKWDFRGP